MPCRADSPPRPNRIVQRLLTLFANQGATGVDDTRLYQEARHRADLMAKLAEISALASSTPDLAAMLDQVMGRMVELVNAERGLFMLYEPESGELVAQYTGSFGATWEQVARLRVKADGPGLTAQVFRSGEPATSNDAPQDPHLLQEFVHLFGVRQLATIPLLVGNRIVGVMHIADKSSGAFTPEDVDLLTTAASHCAAAIENARLLRESRERAKRLAALYRLSMVINSNLSISEVYKAFVVELKALVPFYRASVLVANAAEGFFDGISVTGEEIELPRRRALEGSLLAEMLADGRPRIFPDLQRAPSFPARAHLLREGGRSLIHVPIISQNKVLGCLILASQQPGQYSEKDLETLKPVAEQLALALEKERLFRAVQESERHHREVLDTAGDAIFQLDRKGRLIYVNRTLERMAGATSEELLGRPVWDWMKRFPEAWDRDRIRQEFLSGLETGKPSTYEVKAIDGQGEERYLELHSTPIRREGEMVGVEGIVRDITERKRAEEALRRTTLETLFAVSTVTEARDPYTGGHSQRVTEYALSTARRLGLAESELDTLRIAGLLHDVGKVAIPDAVLHKPGRLTRSEWLVIHAHPGVSASVAEKVVTFQGAVPAIRHHHELWDGTGYPDGLKGEEIPLLSRILAVADWYEALTSDRPYRTALSKEEALEELRRNAGLKLDPEVVEAFLELVAEGAF